MKLVRDMTRAELEREALTDPMTGIGNRRALAEAERGDRGCPVYAVLDIEGVRFVNENYGYETGDALIQAAAAAIESYFGPDSYRVGGDEFVIRSYHHRFVHGLDVITRGFPLLNYGLGLSLKEAGKSLKCTRKEREKAGLRAARGERPRQLARVLDWRVG